MDDFTDEADERAADRVSKKLADLVACAMEHVDTVQLVATKHDKDGTRFFFSGRGDNFARYGACRKYVLDQEREEGDA